jgi:hypothetical protein
MVAMDEVGAMTRMMFRAEEAIAVCFVVCLIGFGYHVVRGVCK